MANVVGSFWFEPLTLLPRNIGPILFFGCHPPFPQSVEKINIINLW